MDHFPEETVPNASVYNFTVYKRWNVTACVPLPYLLLIGNFVFSGNISCANCTLYTCLNNSILLNGQSIKIVKQQPYIWLPVKLNSRIF